MRPKAMLLFLLYAVFALSGSAEAQTLNGTIALSLPNIDWALEIRAPGFVVELKETAKGGEAARFMAANRTTGLIVSGYIEKAPKPGTAKDCREYYWGNMQKSPFKMEEIKMSEFGQMATVEYMVKEHEGIPINQKELYAYLTKDHYWMYIHLSKTAFHPDEDGFFRSVLYKVAIHNKRRGHKSEVIYRVSQDSCLRLLVPQTWQDEIRRPQEEFPPTISLTPGKDGSAEILVTPMWSPDRKPDFNSSARIRQLLEAEGGRLLPQAVEKEIQLHELKGQPLSGYYFSITDKAPKLEPGEYRYMTQGGCGVGDLLVIFTIFSNTKNSPALADTLEMISHAKHHLSEK